MLPVLSLLPACVVLDTSPAEGRLAYLTDEDADGYTLAEGDCNDHDPAVHPDAVDDCDGADTNCDGRIDEAGLLEPLCRDDDGDGHGDPETASVSCELAEGRVALCDDCDDHDPGVSPAAAERCDGFDNNCDERVDGDDAVDQPDWFRDYDGDGYGDPLDVRAACELPAGYVGDSGDCDDRQEEVHPDQDEVCGDGFDTNCDGDVSECGFEGAVPLDPASVDPLAEGYIQGSQAYEYLGAPLSVIADTLDDGTGDVILGSPGLRADGYAAAVRVWYSPPTGLLYATSAPLEIIGPPRASLGVCGDVPVLDVDGDGERELLLCAPGAAEGFPAGGRVFSSPTGGAGSVALGEADVVLEGGVDGDNFSFYLHGSETAVEGGGLIVWSFEDSYSPSDRGLIRLYGRPLSGGDEPAAALRGSSRLPLLGYRAMKSGDANGDGWDDVITTAGGSEGAVGGSVLLFEGPLDGEGDADSADLELRCNEVEDPGAELELLTDLDGDGHPELVVGGAFEPLVADEHTVTFVDPDQRGVVDLEAEARLTWTVALTDPSSLTLRSGDINGDGAADLIAGVPFRGDGSRLNGGGALLGYYGPLTIEGREAFDSRVSFARLGTAANPYAGGNVGVGDVDADGVDDMLLYLDSSPTESYGGAWFLFGEGI